MSRGVLTAMDSSFTHFHHIQYHMKKWPSALFVIGALLLFSLFVLPMWQITLTAPQYKEGVTMLIWIDKIGGKTPGTLQNVNILNHYIGMKKIEPESIPELRYLKYIVAALATSGVIIGFLQKKKLYLAWVILFVLLAALGIYDFYLWEYDYGHNLDPTAPIKIPGASFQPPLFGTKHIINFVATSLPATGGWLAVISLVLTTVAWKFQSPITSTK